MSTEERTPPKEEDRIKTVELDEEDHDAIVFYDKRNEEAWIQMDKSSLVWCKDNGK